MVKDVATVDELGDGSQEIELAWIGEGVGQLDKIFVEMEGEPLALHFQHLNIRLGEQMRVRGIRLIDEHIETFRPEWVRMQEVQSALIKSALLLRALRENITIEEVMRGTMDSGQARSMKFSAPDFFQIKAEADGVPDMPVVGSIMGLELLVRGIYNQVQTGVTDEQAEDWVKTLYERLRESAGEATTHRNQEHVDAYTNQERSAKMLEKTVRELVEKGLIPKNASILIVGPGEGIVERAGLGPLLGNELDENIRIVGVDPEPAHEPWSRMELRQMTVEELAKQETGEQFDLIISWGSGPHNDYSLHSWIEFNAAMQKMAKKGGVIAMEAGTIDQEQGNKRTQMAIAYNLLNPDAMIGTFGIISQHWRGGDKPTDQAVAMFPGLIYEAMAMLMEGKMMDQSYYIATGEDDIRAVWAWSAGEGEMLALIEEATRALFVAGDQRVSEKH